MGYKRLGVQSLLVMATNKNILTGEVGSSEITTDVHSSSVLFIVSVRILMGGMMLFAGLGKFMGEPFDATGYLANVDAVSPVSGLYGVMASSGVLMEIVNVLIPVTQVLIGLALLAGAFVRLAALGGALQMIAFYLGGFSGEWLALFDSTLIYAAVFLLLGAVAAGRAIGVDSYLEDLSIVERYPRLEYILG